MKKSFKKVLSLLLVISMIMASFAVISYAADDEAEFDLRTLTNTEWNKSYASVNEAVDTDIGGKTALKSNYLALNVVKNHASSNIARWKYDMSALSEQSFTLEADVLISEGAVAAIGFGTYSLIVIKDNEITGSGTTTVLPNKANIWHRIALSYDLTTRKANAYVDGIHIGVISGLNFSSLKYASLGVDIGLSAIGSLIVYDNALMYSAPYDSETHLSLLPNVSPVSVPSAVAVENNVIKFDTELVSTTNDLASLLTTSNTGDIKIYTDSTLSMLVSEDSALTGNEYIVVESVDNGYAYYSLDNTYEASANLKVQLVRADDDTSNSNDNWIVNVEVRDDCVTVYSHTENASWKIGSDDLIGILSSNTGYELSYVDANKEEATTNHVTDGFIKAVKGESTLYIPIAKSYDYESGFTTYSNPVTNAQPHINNRYRNAYGQTPVTAANVAGNPATAFGFAVKGAGVTAGDRYDIYQVDENLSDANDTNLNKYLKVTCTYTFNMYAEGDALLYFGSAKGMHIFDWMPNGDVYITRYEGGNSIKDASPVCNLPRGQWHHVAYSLDRPSNRGELYINGNRYVSETGLLPAWNYYKGISLCIAGSADYTEDSVGDRALFSDVEYHEGFYYRDNQDIDVTNATEDFVIDETNNVIYTQNIFTVDALKAAVLANTDASSVKVYADNTFAAEATELADTNVVFVTSANGIRYENFTLKAMSELPDPTVSVTAGNYVFTAKTSKIAEVNKGLTLVMASYNDSNKLVNVLYQPLTANDIGNALTYNLANGEGATNVKAFLWRDGFKPVAAASDVIPVPETPAE